MIKVETGGFLRILIITFTVLFMILVVVPYGVDNAVRFFIREIMPGSNSIIVFRNLPNKSEILNRFFEILKMLTNFM